MLSMDVVDLQIRRLACRGIFCKEKYINAKKSWKGKDTYGLKNSDNRALDTEGIVKSVL